MKLNIEGIKNTAEWESKGYSLPKFDRAAVEAATKAEPFWIHFGAGNIFRAFQANVVQNLLNDGVLDRGLVVAEGYDYEIIEKMYKPHDNIGALVTLKSSGSVEKTVVGSIMEALAADSDNEAVWARLCEIFRNPSLQMVTFTITEKGYLLRNAAGVMMPGVEEDFAQGPVLPKSYIGKVVTLLHERYVNGELPIAMVSMDNCSHNGDKLYAAVNEFAKEWENRGVCKPGFLDYVNNASKVSFIGIDNRLDEVVKGKPAKLFLLTGANDISHNLTSEEIAEGILNLVKRIQKESPKTKIYLQSVFPFNESFKRYRLLNGKTHMVSEINALLEKGAKELKVTFINLYPLLLTNGEKDLALPASEQVLNPNITRDGLHLTPDGYKIWSAAIEKYVK